MLGIIGVEDRMQGTVISQIVNQASHLEQLTKKYGSAMLVTQQVISNHIDEYPTRYIGRVKVYDVSTVNYLDLFEVLSAENDPVYEMKLKSKMNFEQGVKLFYEKCFAEASVQFTLSLKSFPEDKAGKDYLKQCAALMISGVPDNWDGANPL
jgi:alpha-galactosidase